jgi:hypothetical protein
MEVRFRKTGGIAIALILLGFTLPACYARWLNTRTFVALEMPVSLAPAKFSSESFEVNLKGWYQIGTDVDQSFPFKPNCGFGGRPPLLRTHISIYENGRFVEGFDGEDRFLGHLHAEPGKRYRLDLEVLTDASCLNSGHPRIFVWTEYGYYEHIQSIVWVISALLLLCGFGILLFSAATPVIDHENAQSELRISEGAGTYCPRHRVRPLRPRFAGIPHFGLVYAVIVAALLPLAFVIYLYSWGFGHPSTGIHVRLVRPGPLRSPGFAPPDLLLHVECPRLDAPNRLYLNSKLVSAEALPDVLKLELKFRADWIVYIEGEPDCTWEKVASTMDIARTAGAQVVLLTATAPSDAVRRQGNSHHP